MATDNFGYKPELKRSLGSFQVFAISFASVSVIIGIFSTYGDVLQSSGPLGIWLFPMVGAGQILVALVYAQFAARIPLSGSSYQWGSRLANPKVGWMFGWVAICNSAISAPTVNQVLATQCLMPLFNIAPNDTIARNITIALLLIQAAIVILSTRILGWMNSLAVGVELVIVVVLGIALVVTMMLTGHGSTANLMSQGIAAGAPNYYAIGGGLMAAMIMGLSTLLGFEAAANMAEEAKDPHRAVPRAMVGSVIIATILGTLFIIALTVSISDMGAVSRSGSPVAEIMREQFGPGLERPFLVVVAVAMFGGALISMAGVTRMIYAMARDDRFPGHRVFKRVNPRTGTPIAATVLQLGFGIALIEFMNGNVILQLLLAGAIIVNMPYGMTITLYLVVRKKLDRKDGAFNLGRFELPVATAAILWLLFATFVSIVSSPTMVPILIVVGMVGVGGIYLGYLLVFKKHVLEVEPGHTDATPEPGEQKTASKELVSC